MRAKQINIKNEETYRLASELIRFTGESMTQAITRSIKDRLEKLSLQSKAGRKGTASRILTIAAKASSKPILDARSPDEILYDKNGLPK